MICICVLRFTLYYIKFRWSRKFVYSPLSFHYKCIVIHSTVSHLVRVKEQIKLCKSMGCLSYNVTICDHHHMRPLIYNTLHFKYSLYYRLSLLDFHASDLLSLSDFWIISYIGSFGLFDSLYCWANVICVSVVCRMRIGHWKHYLTVDS